MDGNNLNVSINLSNVLSIYSSLIYRTNIDEKNRSLLQQELLIPLQKRIILSDGIAILPGIFFLFMIFKRK